MLLSKITRKYSNADLALEKVRRVFTYFIYTLSHEPRKLQPNTPAWPRVS